MVFDRVVYCLPNYLHYIRTQTDLLFSPVKSVCIVCKPCRFKLYCPTVSIGTEPLTYVNRVKYLAFLFCENKEDGEDIC